MNWKTKALIQRAVARLPLRISYAAYYLVQRRFGGLRKITPLSSCKAALTCWERIEQAHGTPMEKVFFEVGTGRRLTVPVTLWLLGAGKVITADLNPYLKLELVREDLSLLYEAALRELPHLIARSLPDRVAAFREIVRSTFALQDLMQLCNIEYHAPANATRLPLPDKSVDYHISFTVFEHIPFNVLHDILREGNRIIKPGGLFVHRIDYSDHFAHEDKTISLLNFLQFEQAEWDRLAGNRYMYMNRCRDDDYQQLFREVGHRIMRHEPDVNVELLRGLRMKTVPIHSDFSNRSPETLATTAAWFVTTCEAR